MNRSDTVQSQGPSELRSARGRALVVLLAGIVLALALAACGGSGAKNAPAGTTGVSGDLPGRGRPPVVIGDKNFTEQFVLGELYAQALRAKGYRVQLKANIGTSEITDQALTRGTIDMYPEYTGTILSVLAHRRRPPRDAAAAYAAARRFEESRGFALLARTPFADSDALAVKPAYARRHHLRSLADLARMGRSVTVGAPPEFQTRYAGLIGLREAYGADPSFQPLLIGQQYQALDSGRVDAADVFTTEGRLGRGHYRVLADPKDIFGFQNAAPVVNRRVLDREGPAFARTLNAVSATLTTRAMQSMNAAVDVDHERPADVARRFLAQHHLL